MHWASVGSAHILLTGHQQGVDFVLGSYAICKQLKPHHQTMFSLLTEYGAIRIISHLHGMFK